MSYFLNMRAITVVLAPTFYNAIYALSNNDARLTVRPTAAQLMITGNKRP